MRKIEFDHFVQLGLCKKNDAKEIIQSLVNWLITSLVEEVEGRWIAYVDEADPLAYDLQRWLESWLNLWGWNVRVVTEW